MLPSVTKLHINTLIGSRFIQSLPSVVHLSTLCLIRARPLDSASRYRLPEEAERQENAMLDTFCSVISQSCPIACPALEDLTYELHDLKRRTVGEPSLEVVLGVARKIVSAVNARAQAGFPLSCLRVVGEFEVYPSYQRKTWTSELPRDHSGEYVDRQANTMGEEEGWVVHQDDKGTGTLIFAGAHLARDYDGDMERYWRLPARVEDKVRW